jgi:hypothetical protein
MSEITSDFLSELARKIAISDAKADAELADIMAGRPYKKRAAAPEPASDQGATEKKAPAARKPRAKRTPAKKTSE